MRGRITFIATTLNELLFSKFSVVKNDNLVIDQVVVPTWSIFV